jgi:hypothetical protein
MKLLSLFVLLCSLSLGVFAQGEQRIAIVAGIQGEVDAKINNKDWSAVTVGMTLQQGDVIRTKANSFAVLNIDGDAQTAVVDVSENSQLMLKELLQNNEKQTQSTLLDLSIGKILIRAKKINQEKSKFEVKTPTSIVGVRGTTFSVAVEAEE